ncbi:hypothetical protein J6590_069921 [Homalodisca vitripennis]|nr:hypothetical protein J6590_069921 [Homalodisca vitripennis]
MRAIRKLLEKTENKYKASEDQYNMTYSARRQHRNSILTPLLLALKIHLVTRQCVSALSAHTQVATRKDHMCRPLSQAHCTITRHSRCVPRAIHQILQFAVSSE